MEIVDFHGYTEREKLEIARHYLVKRTLEDNGLDETKLLELTDDAIREVNTLHARVRRAQPRARARQARAQDWRAESRRKRSSVRLVDRADVRSQLGRPRVHPEKAAREDQIGISTGMYYTPQGGDIMFVEAARCAARAI